MLTQGIDLFLQRLLKCSLVIDDKHELIAAVSCAEAVQAVRHIMQSVSHEPERLIADNMAEFVVYELEVININYLFHKRLIL